MTKDQSKSFNTRLATYQIFLLLFVAMVLLRLSVVAIGQHGYYKALAENQHEFFQKLVPTRGDIYISDKYANGQPYVVATNATKNMVYAIPREITDPQQTAKQLAAILSLDGKDLLSKITDRSRQYVPLMHGLTDDQSNAVSAAKFSGIFLEPENVRYYPETALLSQVLGFLGYTGKSDAKVGLYGLEKYFQKQLAGTVGQVSTEADFKGNWITGSKRDFTPAVDGSSLLLTIDRSIQYKAESVLADAIQKHGADSGTVIVENPKTGAILAMANYPNFDPNQYNKVTDPSVFLNAATTESYEPGSTMKAVTLSAGLDLGLITPDTTFNDTGEVKVDNYTIHNSDKLGHGIVSMKDVIDHSLNTGAIWVEQQIGNDKFLEYLKRFGFGKATNVELPETVGNLSTLKGNVQINYYTASFGQGITVTPIQMLQAYQAIANGGKMMQPYIVDSVIAPDSKKTVTQPTVTGQVISSKAAMLMSAMLVDDVENGYGKRAAVPGYYIAGKTGTAQIAQNGKYIDNGNIGSFVGFGPVENPQFVMLVNINRPKDVKFAESTAAPAFGEIAKFILNYYQVAPDR